jgi:hypothetical protein
LIASFVFPLNILDHSFQFVEFGNNFLAFPIGNIRSILLFGFNSLFFDVLICQLVEQLDLISGD